MKKNTIKKLSLNKVSIVDFDQMETIKGGKPTDIETKTGCPTEDPCPTRYIGCTTAAGGTGSGGSYTTGWDGFCDIQWK